jgi:hypothetical protein
MRSDPDGVVQEVADRIALDDSSELLTFRDAAKYIRALPEAERHAVHWKIAMEALTVVAERNAPELLARIAVLMALNDGRRRQHLSRDGSLASSGRADPALASGLSSGDRGTKSKPVPDPHLVFGFLTTAPNAVVEPIQALQP